jgi:hypothetical protein
MTTSRSNADVDRRRFLGVGAFEAVLRIAGYVGAGYRSQSGTGELVERAAGHAPQYNPSRHLRSTGGRGPMLSNTGGIDNPCIPNR